MSNIQTSVISIITKFHEKILQNTNIRAMKVFIIYNVSVCHYNKIWNLQTSHGHNILMLYFSIKLRSYTKFGALFSTVDVNFRYFAYIKIFETLNLSIVRNYCLIVWHWNIIGVIFRHLWFHFLFSSSDSVLAIHRMLIFQSSQQIQKIYLWISCTTWLDLYLTYNLI